MIKELLHIRVKQFQRMSKDLGLFWILFFMGMAALIVYVINAQIGEAPNKFIIFGLFVMMITVLHFNRKDKGFIKLIADTPAKVFLIEYLVLSIPFIVLLIFHGEWLVSLLLPLLLLGVALIKVKSRSKSLNNVFIKSIPESAFEWKAGVRRYFYPLVFMMLFGLGTSTFIAGIPIAIFVLGITVIGFYQECESRMVLMAEEKNAKDFILKKIKMGLSLFAALIVPLSIVFLLFHISYWYVPLILFVAISFVLIYIILLKYAFYEPNVVKSSNSLWAMMGVAGLLVPPFLPTVWVLSVYFYFKSIKKLNPYLYAFN